MTSSEAEARLRELVAIEATSFAADARHAGSYTVAQPGEIYVEHARKLGPQRRIVAPGASMARVASL